MMRINKSSKTDFLFPILCGIIATLWQYKFGEGDQLDHLLFVYKAINPDFLSNDAYVSLAEGFSVRYYFAQFIGLFAKLCGTECSFLIFTLLSNVFTSIVTFLVANTILKYKASAWVACILVMTLTTINMGDVPSIYATGLAPDRLAFPLILFAFYWALKEKPIYVALFAGIASLFHIMLGAVSGGVFLVAMFVNYKSRTNKTYLLIIFKALGILFAFSLFTLLPYFFNSEGSISTDEFIQTYAYFRVPHHLVPTYIFASGIALRSLVFFMGAGVAGYLLYKNKVIELKQISFIVIVTTIFFTLCLTGYLFIEVFPNRIGVFLQAFRYLTFVKWLALILVGVYIGKMLSVKSTFISGLYLFASVLSPFLMCFSFCFEAFYQRTKQWHQKLRYLPYLGLFLVLIYLGYKAFNPETVVLVIYLILLLAYIYIPKIFFKILVGAYAVFIGVNIMWLSKLELNNSWFKNNFNPVFTFTKKANAKVDIALQIKKQLQEQSMLLAPPNMLEVKTVGERASVVSFKAVPFGDIAIKDWKERLDFCYGRTNKLGFEAEQDLIENYKQISDIDLLRIKEKYGIEYAVLFASTNTELKVLYKNDIFKLVEVPFLLEDMETLSRKAL